MSRPPKYKQPAYLLHCGILEKWHDKTIHDFSNDAKAKKCVKEYVELASSHLKKGIGMYLYGANGVGKSLLLNVAFMKLLELGHKVRIVSLPDLITMFADSWSNHEEREHMEKEILGTQFLGIEEIGKEYGSVYKENPLAINAVDNIIRKRLQRNRPTWITTNVKPSDITRIYTEDIASMLRESCIIVQVTGEDKRHTIQSDLSKKYLS